MHNGTAIVLDRRRLFSDLQRLQIAEIADGRCALCDTSLPAGWHAHHVIPHAAGGPTTIENGAPVCPACHPDAHRHQQALETWLEERLPRWRTRAEMPAPGAFTLSQAAEYCGHTLAVVRKRADRGSLKTFKRDGVRYVTRDELERAGLLIEPEVMQLRREVTQLRDELTVHRRLTQHAQAAVDAERQAHEIAATALTEQRAIAQTAQARASELEQLERDLTAAGPIRAWRLARQHRRSSLTE